MTNGNDDARRVSTPNRLRGKTFPDSTGEEQNLMGYCIIHVEFRDTERKRDESHKENAHRRVQEV